LVKAPTLRKKTRQERRVSLVGLANDKQIRHAMGLDVQEQVLEPLRYLPRSSVTAPTATANLRDALFIGHQQSSMGSGLRSFMIVQRRHERSKKRLGVVPRQFSAACQAYDLNAPRQQVPATG
jgi:hypothetical protein